jgi:hypothetical protein
MSLPAVLQSSHLEILLQAKAVRFVGLETDWSGIIPAPLRLCLIPHADSRGQWQVRLYCRFARYDLEAAAAALVHLHNITGSDFHDEATHSFVRDAMYFFALISI